jgi:glutamine amidotransferase-like uncharacterized protein
VASANLLLILIAGVPLSAQESPAQAPRISVAVFQIDEERDLPVHVVEDLQRDSLIQPKAITAAEIQQGKLSNFQAVMFPGGSGSAQGQKLDKLGREQVRQFVLDGGGYIGICAGAYLASADYDWSLHLLDAKVLDRKHWDRGFGTVQLRVSEGNGKHLGVYDAEIRCYYHQGPLLSPANRDDLPDFESWAVFDSEVKKKGVPDGIMVGTTAIAASHFGRGRVLAISPHPEKTESLDHVLAHAVHWVIADGKETRKP